MTAAFTLLTTGYDSLDAAGGASDGNASESASVVRWTVLRAGDTTPGTAAGFSACLPVSSTLTR
ncbi:hypothetical protein OG241_43800 [Streptomyces sp. NBC_01390]|uniref:hypothetical protein n=1 Tax=Streptomyces sp. NBC_01390 TaxID=2903850 RepID=UPI003243CD6E